MSIYEQAIARLEGRAPRERAVAFLFPGQGAQHVAMARELYAVEAVFRRELDRVAELFAPYLGLDLRRVLYPTPDGRAQAEATLAGSRVGQPALFAVEHALARLWMSWGVTPRAMLGQGVGELVAACLAGVFSVEDGVAITALRGRLMEEAAPSQALFHEQLRRVRLAAPRIPFVAGLNGTWIRPEEATDPAYWGRHLVESVKFSAGVAALLAEPDRVLLEVGPGRVLSVLASRATPQAAGRTVLASLGNPGDPGTDVSHLAAALGRLWLPDEEALPAPPLAPVLRFPAARAFSPFSSSSRPRGAVEEQVAALWCQLLDLPEVGRDDDFIALGGDSLLGLQMLLLLREETGVEVAIEELFAEPTVAAVAAAVSARSAGRGEDAKLVLVPR
jgi:acyl transferase domain-containing protein/acyl carrier protein